MTVWKFVLMKKPTSAIQEFLKSGSNEVYHNPERLQQISGNLTWKYGTQIDFKLLTWWMFVRIWRCSLLEGRVGTDIRETLNILLCADCSMFLCIFRRFVALFGTFSHSGFLLHLVPMERLRAIDRSTWSSVSCNWVQILLLKHY